MSKFASRSLCPLLTSLLHLALEEQRHRLQQRVRDGLVRGVHRDADDARTGPRLDARERGGGDVGAVAPEAAVLNWPARQTLSLLASTPVTTCMPIAEAASEAISCAEGAEGSATLPSAWLPTRSHPSRNLLRSASRGLQKEVTSSGSRSCNVIGS